MVTFNVKFPGLRSDRMHLSDRIFQWSDPLYHAADTYWKNPRTQSRVGNLLAWAFVVFLLAIEANRAGWLPGPLAPLVPTNPFHAVSGAFSVLLGFEILGLVFVLPQSISDSVGKQFEILSIILLRDSFQEFIHFEIPLRWDPISGSLLPIMADTFGGLVTFVAIGLFYRLQRHRPITRNEEAQKRFRAVKRLLALVLLVIFAWVGAQDAWEYLRRETPSNFFDAFFTVLVFSDILLIFLSLRYTSSYQVVFRNSGFALATVFIRLSVTAPHYFNVALAVGSALFAVCLALAYNSFAPPPLVSRLDVPETR